MTTEIERTTAAHECALSDLLLEFELLTDKKRRRLTRRYPSIAELLKAVSRTRKEFHDAVFIEANTRLRAEDEESDSLICCVLITDDEGDTATWYCFPEVTGIASRDGMITLMSQRHPKARRLLVRAIPRKYVHDLRNAPRDSTFVASCTEWTLENQGLPSWEDELNSPDIAAQIEELSGGHERLGEKIRQYVASSGEMPSATWVDDVRAVLNRVDALDQQLQETQS